MSLKNQDKLILIEDLKDTISQEKQILNEIKKLYGIKNIENEKVISSQIKSHLNNLNKLNNKVENILKELVIPQNFIKQIFGFSKGINILKKDKKFKIDDLEKESLKNLKKKEKVKKEKVKSNDEYGKIANRFCSKYSKKLIEKKYFLNLEEDIKKSNLKHTLQGYVSIILFTTFLSILAGFLIFVFLLFFNIEATLPIIKPVSDVGSRIGKLVWILIVIPLTGFFISYSYPSVERKNAEAQIDYELPFATINMAAIAGSLISPIKIFEIITTSNEFPHVKKELTKLLNEINIYGYDIVNASQNIAEITPSKKMSELLKGLATTINSGGDLTQFFKTRADSLLFEYKINRNKETKSAETFMDLYISIVIAAPMIFMLLLMMLKISGLGISIPTSTITLIMVFGVAMINGFFLLFLHLKKKNKTG